MPDRISESELSGNHHLLFGIWNRMYHSYLGHPQSQDNVISKTQSQSNSKVYWSPCLVNHQNLSYSFSLYHYCPSCAFYSGIREMKRLVMQYTNMDKLLLDFSTSLHLQILSPHFNNQISVIVFCSVCVHVSDVLRYWKII